MQRLRQGSSFCLFGRVPDRRHHALISNHSRSILLNNSYKLNLPILVKIMEKLEGKVAVITGGNSGIGLATAQRFVSEGAYVFITGRRQSELDAAVKQIGKNVSGVQGDVSNLADLDRLYVTVKEQKGRIDILFANAGVGELVPLGAITEAHFDKTFGINVKGLVFTVQKALPLFRTMVRSF
jgi:NAD(P)-dependent dehydrogenase (short-subunit alcohol dehydrogenase family)